MAVWYQVEKTEEGLQQFLESNCEFHDYRIERVDYHAAEDYTDVYLAYDTGTEGVLIRFLGMIRLTIPLGRLYAGAWLSGTTVFVSERNSIVWIPEEDCDDPGTEEECERIMLHYGWIEAEEICWAVTDAEGNPVEMPADRMSSKSENVPNMMNHKRQMIWNCRCVDN